MKKAIYLLLMILFIAAIVFSGGCTGLNPGEALYADEFYGDSPTETPIEGDLDGDLDKLPDDIDKLPDDIEKIEDARE